MLGHEPPIHRRSTAAVRCPALDPAAADDEDFIALRRHAHYPPIHSDIAAHLAGEHAAAGAPAATARGRPGRNLAVDAGPKGAASTGAVPNAGRHIGKSADVSRHAGARHMCFDDRKPATTAR